MMLEITSEQAEVLRGLVDEALKSLSVEIHRTDSLTYRSGLQSQEQKLRSLQLLLEEVPEAAQF